MCNCLLFDTFMSYDGYVCLLWSGDQNGGAAIFREQQFLFCFYDGGKTDQGYSGGNDNELNNDVLINQTLGS